MKQILNFDHELWDEFENGMQDSTVCDATTKFAKSILERLAKDAPIDIEGTLCWFQSMGGYCDCEINFNVIWQGYSRYCPEEMMEV